MIPESFNPQPEAQAGLGVDHPFTYAAGCGLNERCVQDAQVLIVCSAEAAEGSTQRCGRSAGAKIRSAVYLWPIAAGDCGYSRIVVGR